MSFLEKYDAFLFDFDGVIVDSIDVHVEAIRLFSKRDFDRELLSQIMKGNFFENSKKMEYLNSVDWEEYREFVKNVMIKRNPVPSLHNVVKNLKRKNKKMVIISSGSKEVITTFLRKHNVDYFDDILGFEFHRDKTYKINYVIEKYSLNSDRVLFITDTLGDILEAKKVGVDSVAVNYGLHDEKTLSLGKPIKCIGCLEEIIK